MSRVQVDDGSNFDHYTAFTLTKPPKHPLFRFLSSCPDLAPESIWY